jgi:hypothetical protein
MARGRRTTKGGLDKGQGQSARGKVVSTNEVSTRRGGSSLVIEPIEIERDEKGWPRALWELAGSAPDFDLGDRTPAHERDDVLVSSRPRR